MSGLLFKAYHVQEDLSNWKNVWPISATFLVDK